MVKFTEVEIIGNVGGRIRTFVGTKPQDLKSCPIDQTMGLPRREKL